MVTRVMMIVDKSGSMNTIRQSTIEGINEYLGDRRREAEEGLEQRFSLLFFSDTSHFQWVVQDKSPLEVEDLTPASFVPSGGTALFDAIAAGIEKLLAEDVKYGPLPANLVIVTDGGENSSFQYSLLQSGAERIKRLIDDCQSRLGWTIYYIGANQDAFAVGVELGVAGGNTMSYAHDHRGAMNAFAVASRATNAYNGRGGAYSAADLSGLRGLTS